MKYVFGHLSYYENALGQQSMVSSEGVVRGSSEALWLYLSYKMCWSVKLSNNVYTFWNADTNLTLEVVSQSGVSISQKNQLY